MCPLGSWRLLKQNRTVRQNGPGSDQSFLHDSQDGPIWSWPPWTWLQQRLGTHRFNVVKRGGRFGTEIGESPRLSSHKSVGLVHLCQAMTGFGKGWKECQNLSQLGMTQRQHPTNIASLDRFSTSPNDTTKYSANHYDNLQT